MDSRSCHLAPKTVSFHYLSLPSNLKTPATLFRMATAAVPGRAGPDSLRFGIVGGNSRSIFVMQRSDRQTGELILVQQLRGPQEISVDVDMSEYSDRTFQAKHVAQVHILVSPYNFWAKEEDKETENCRKFTLTYFRNQFVWISSHSQNYQKSEKATKLIFNLYFINPKINGEL